jgi:hypothetical protein
MTNGNDHDNFRPQLPNPHEVGRNAVCNANKAQALALLEFGHPVLGDATHTGLGIQTRHDIRSAAVERDYDLVTAKAFEAALLESGRSTLSEEDPGKAQKLWTK